MLETSLMVDQIMVSKGSYPKITELFGVMNQ